METGLYLLDALYPSPNYTAQVCDSAVRERAAGVHVAFLCCTVGLGWF